MQGHTASEWSGQDGTQTAQFPSSRAEPRQHLVSVSDQGPLGSPFSEPLTLLTAR